MKLRQNPIIGLKDAATTWAKHRNTSGRKRESAWQRLAYWARLFSKPGFIHCHECSRTFRYDPSRRLPATNYCSKECSQKARGVPVAKTNGAAQPNGQHVKPVKQTTVKAAKPAVNREALETLRHLIDAALQTKP